MTTKTIKKRVRKICSCCGKEINVILYSDKNYRGGHYFGKVPVYDENSYKKATVKVEKKTGWRIVSGLKIKEKIEYWEWPRCYRGK
ncbi:MAG: hypothetical protein WCT11_00450 [Candidatus Magasanikbacteria bacterium]